MIADIKNPRILISNDDGFDACGIKILEDVARTISDDIWVVAPKDQKSGASQSISMLKGGVKIYQEDERHFVVDGTPADCMVAAFYHIFKDQKKPDLVLSGVNKGANLGNDVLYSGTVGAASEAAWNNVPAIAFSQRRDHKNKDKDYWNISEHFLPKVLDKLFKLSWPFSDVIINVNFPKCEIEEVNGIKVVKLGKHVREKGVVSASKEDNDIVLKITGGFEDINHSKDTDIGSSTDNMITITPVATNRTHWCFLDDLEKIVFEL